MQELLCYDDNIIATLSCFSEEVVFRDDSHNPKTLGIKKQDLTYAYRVSRENPELANVAVALLCYHNCAYCVEQNTKLKGKISAYLTGVSGSAEPSTLKKRTECLKLTKRMCDAVEFVAKEMSAAIKTDKHVKTLLAILIAVNKLPELVTPTSSKHITYALYLEAVSYVAERYGPVFKDIMTEIMAFEETRDKSDIFLHNTELLLSEYQKCKYRGSQSRDSAVRAAHEREIGISLATLASLMGAEDYSMSELEQAEFIHTIISLVDSLKESLRNYPEEGEKLYEAMDFFYDDQISKTAKNVLEKFKSCKIGYKRKDEAITVMSILLWGCTASDIINMIYKPLSRASKKTVTLQEENNQEN